MPAWIPDSIPHLVRPHVVTLATLIGFHSWLATTAGASNPASPQTENSSTAADTPPPGRGVARASEQIAEAGFELLAADDVLLSQSTLAYEESRSVVRSRVSLQSGLVALDYAPVDFDFLGYPTRRDEHRHGAQAELTVRAAGRWSILASAGFYDGFPDYRSVWISEFFRQQYSGLPGYIEPDPSGISASAGFRWEYLPATAFLQATLGWTREHIAPGYEIDFDGLRRAPEILETPAFLLTAENALTPRIRMQHQVRIAETTDRETRYGYQGAVNFALGERWILRLQGGATTEKPTFDAWFAGGTLEFETSDTLTLLLTGRYYRDTGEIENSLFSTAAPGLESYQFGIGARLRWGRSTVRILAAPYFTRYEPFGLGTAFFAGLYRDRDWGLAQFAYSFSF